MRINNTRTLRRKSEYHSPEPSNHAQGTTLRPRPRCIPGTIEIQRTSAWSEPEAPHRPPTGILGCETAPPPADRRREHIYKEKEYYQLLL